MCGIWFYQGENQSHGTVAILEELCVDELLTFTNVNWGPRDASKPRENKTQLVTLNELRSIQGFFMSQKQRVLCIGGSIVKNKAVAVHV